MTRDGFTITDRETLRRDHDAQRITDDARTSTAPVRDWDYAEALARFDLAQSAESMGVRA